MSKKRKVVYLNKSAQIRNYLKLKKIPHEMVATLSTTILLTDDKKYICANKHLTKKQFSLISKVKSYTSKLDFDKTEWEPHNIRYFRFGKASALDLSNYFEVDVNKAYWNIAYQLGYINESIYRYGLDKSDKTSRLVALGSLASKKKLLTFDGNSYKFKGYKFDEIKRSWFFHISGQLDKIMQEVYNKCGTDGFVLYWVDAFIVHPDLVNTIKNTLSMYGLDIKIKQMKSIRIRPDFYGLKYWMIEKVSETDKLTNIKFKFFTKPRANNNTLDIGRIKEYMRKL